MGGGYLVEALAFLTRTLFSLYILAVALRFLLQLARADFYNPISQLLIKMTDPALRPLRRIIPGYTGMDWPSIILLLLLLMLETVLTRLLLGLPLPAIASLFILACAEALQMCIYIYIVVILVQVIISWINPGAYSPATVLLYELTEPLLSRARRLLPVVSGLDFSPLAVLVFLQLLLILLVKPLLALAYSI
ncbi:MAG: YggT family protein [Gammaproteobacteria bacterium]